MSHKVIIHPAQISILRDLLFTKGMKYSQIQKNSGLSSDHFKFHIKQLLEKGFVTKETSGIYNLTSAGKVHANTLDTDSNTIERQPKSAVLLLIEHPTDHDRFLFQQRKKQPYYDFWGLPGGKIRWGETIHQAASRELYEETKLTAETHFIGVYHEHSFNQDNELLEDKIFFIFRCTNVSGTLMETFEAGDNKFLTVEDTRKLSKKYQSFDLELDYALGNRPDALLEQTQIYTNEQF
jgi:8-oxo-dGTP diphosphatase